MTAHLPLKPPPALRRPQAAPALSSLQLGVPGGTTLFVKLTLTAAVSVNTPVTLSTDDPTATLPATVTVPTGASFVRFSVQTKSPLTRRFLTIRATLAGVSRPQQITLEPASLAPVVTGFFAGDGVTPLTHGLPGTLFVIRGSGLGPLAGQVVFDPTGRAVISQWTDTRVTGTVPDPGDGPRVHETVQVALPQATTFLPAASEFVIDGTPTPPRLGTVQRTSTGLLIQGSGFGTLKGTVSAGGIPLAVLTWAPTAITTAAPLGALGMLTIRRADGQWYSSTPGLLPAARLPGWPR